MGCLGRCTHTLPTHSPDVSTAVLLPGDREWAHVWSGRAAGKQHAGRAARSSLVTHQFSTVVSRTGLHPVKNADPGADPTRKDPRAEVTLRQSSCPDQRLQRKLGRGREPSNQTQKTGTCGQHKTTVGSPQRWGGLVSLLLHRVLPVSFQNVAAVKDQSSLTRHSQPPFF